MSGHIIALVTGFIAGVFLTEHCPAQTRHTPMFYVDGWVRPSATDPSPQMTNMILVDCFGYAQTIHGHRDPVEAARAAATEIVTRLEPPDLTPRDLDRDHVCILLLSFGRDAELPGDQRPSRGRPENYHAFRRFGLLL